MGKILLVSRLAARDLRHRPAQAVLVLLVIAAAATTLTLGLALHGVTSQPYQRTRAATAGPDVVVSAFGQNGGSAASLMALARAPGVTGHSGPYPLASPVLRAHGHAVAVQAEGRDPAPASIDQPKLTQGSWVRPGEVVVERSFADVLGIRAGNRVTLNGRPFRVAGIAVTAALPSYPMESPGQIWLPRADARSLAPSPQSHATSGQPQPPDFLLNLRLADPAAARAFANAHETPGLAMMAWQDTRDQDATLVTNSQQDLLIGSWLLGLLAAASVAVLVGGRMAEQTRRVGLLKAVGGTPGLVAAVLLAENLFLAMIAAAAGLAAGRLAAPLLTSPGAGLVGTPGAPSLTVPAIALVAAAALTVAMIATLVPAIRAARTSTIRALAGAARPPRRRAGLIAASARLPVPLLLGLRLAARRPRRAVLSATRPPAASAGPRHRVDLHRGITPRDQVRIQARHRRQPPGDRPRRQPRLPVRQPDHRPVPPLIGQEVEHIRRGDRHRALRDDSEERLQVESHRPQRVRPAPARHELQIPVHQPVTEAVTHLARPRHETRKTREAAHFSTIPVSDARILERHGSPVY